MDQQALRTSHVKPRCPQNPLQNVLLFNGFYFYRMPSASCNQRGGFQKSKALFRESVQQGSYWARFWEFPKIAGPNIGPKWQGSHHMDTKKRLPFYRNSHFEALHLWKPPSARQLTLVQTTSRTSRPHEVPSHHQFVVISAFPSAVARRVRRPMYLYDMYTYVCIYIYIYTYIEWGLWPQNP